MTPYIARDTQQPLVVLGGYQILADGRVVTSTIDVARPGDYGADPLGNGWYRMVPSGDVVDYATRNARLRKGS